MDGTVTERVYKNTSLQPTKYITARLVEQNRVAILLQAFSIFGVLVSSRHASILVESLARAILILKFLYILYVE